MPAERRLLRPLRVLAMTERYRCLRREAGRNNIVAQFEGTPPASGTGGWFNDAGARASILHHGQALGGPHLDPTGETRGAAKPHFLQGLRRHGAAAAGGAVQHDIARLRAA